VWALANPDACITIPVLLTLGVGFVGLRRFVQDAGQRCGHGRDAVRIDLHIFTVVLEFAARAVRKGGLPLVAVQNP
jgi:hypothetical protein